MSHRKLRSIKRRLRGSLSLGRSVSSDTIESQQNEGNNEQPQPPADPFPIDAWTDPNYHAWYEQHCCSEETLAEQRIQAKQFDYQPVFSIVVPLYKTPLEFFRTMADSVLSQTYGKIQLILVNASPEDKKLMHLVNRYAKKDSRITVVTLDANLGITENTNKGLDAATGDFCCFLDHDDYIEPDLFFEYVSILNSNNEIDFIYCDEDMVEWDEENETFYHLRPLFKPAYSPELLLCKNYIMHFTAIRKSILDSMPRPDARYDGSQDYNMALYSTDQARAVYRVPKVLYHWRIHESSTATNPESKPYTIQSCRLAIWEHLGRCELDASIVETGIYDLYNPWFRTSFLDNEPKISLIVDGDRDRASTERFLQFFEQENDYKALEIFLINADIEDREFGGHSMPITCLSSDKSNLFERLNEGAQSASGDYLIFLDTGCTFISPDALAQLSAMFKRNGIGCVGPKLLYRGNINKSYGVAVTYEGIFPLYRGYDDDFPAYQCNTRCFQNVSGVGWQGLTTTKELFARLGGFDTRFTGEIAAVEYCWRAHTHGLRTVAMCTVKLKVNEPAPQARYNCASNASDYSAEDLALFDEKWPAVRKSGDFYLNANLDQGSEYFQVPAVKLEPEPTEAGNDQLSVSE